jgi:hypothetical protein
VVQLSPAIVIACDRLFESVVGEACGGPAEDSILPGVVASIPDAQPSYVVVDRFDASPRTSVSIYMPKDAP